jgi:hypothetical protein
MTGKMDKGTITRQRYEIFNLLKPYTYPTPLKDRQIRNQGTWYMSSTRGTSQASQDTWKH